jgi:hypothetical protein
VVVQQLVHDETEEEESFCSRALRALVSHSAICVSTGLMAWLYCRRTRRRTVHTTHTHTHTQEFAWSIKSNFSADWEVGARTAQDESREGRRAKDRVLCGHALHEEGKVAREGRVAAQGESGRQYELE